jgi:acyl-CoA synthetase (AMP-forming)/AMP-acid ligase II
MCKSYYILGLACYVSLILTFTCHDTRGGLLRNILAPIFSGGSTICCPAFDPSLFWDVIDGPVPPTWYYASPSIHQIILDHAEYRQAALSNSRIRLICNAAGALLPALAIRLRDTFQSTVLPSYGMTE